MQKSQILMSHIFQQMPCRIARLDSILQYQVALTGVFFFAQHLGWILYYQYAYIWHLQLPKKLISSSVYIFTVSCPSLVTVRWNN